MLASAQSMSPEPPRWTDDSEGTLVGGETAVITSALHHSVPVSSVKLWDFWGHLGGDILPQAPVRLHKLPVGTSGLRGLSLRPQHPAPSCWPALVAQTHLGAVRNCCG